ncbi:hypothetical protein AABB24_011805 [Solanum stoloniferum]|uniref:Uncharacterized protein n=1 Tax=Solanum stoloniferum TaxID=62892 RepID=A0ABD2UFI0_9SOLN
MAGAWSPIARRVLGSTVIELSRSNSRAGASFPVRISARSHGVSTCEEREAPLAPSCIFVGPIETASKETLEALYRQARDAYYSGMPLIVDDMFDKVELRLRWYGSKHVVKYPRCSLRRHSTYADAEMKSLHLPWKKEKENIMDVYVHYLPHSAICKSSSAVSFPRRRIFHPGVVFLLVDQAFVLHLNID